MSARFLAAGAATTLALAACFDVTTDPRAVGSIGLDSIASPSVVTGDSLRDTLGVARPLRASVFNPLGVPLATIPVRYYAADSGIVVDSVTGFVIGGAPRTTPVRVVAQAGGVQTVPVPLFVVPVPDSVDVPVRVDSFPYSLRDTTRDLSPPLTVRVLHAAGSTQPEPVQGYIVSYSVVYPADSSIVRLVGDNGVSRAIVDTTASDGTASRRVRVAPARLTTPNDTVIVTAMVRYRGVPIAGAPVRFRMRLAPVP